MQAHMTFLDFQVAELGKKVILLTRQGWKMKEMDISDQLFFAEWTTTTNDNHPSNQACLIGLCFTI